MKHRITRNKRSKQTRKTRRNIKGGNRTAKQFIEACKNGDLNTIQNIYQRNANMLQQSDVIQGFKIACNRGHANVAEWLYQVDPQSINSLSSSSNFYDLFYHNCIENGNLQIAQLVFQIRPDVIQLDQPFTERLYSHIFSRSIDKKHLDIAKWLLQIHPELMSYFKDMGIHYFIEFCEEGRLDFMQWFAEGIPKKLDMNGKWTKKAFRIACEKNYRDIMEWFRMKNPARFSFEYDATGKPVCQVRKINPKWESRKMGLVAMKKGNNLLGRLPTDVAKMALEYV